MKEGDFRYRLCVCVVHESVLFLRSATELREVILLAPRSNHKDVARVGTYQSPSIPKYFARGRMKQTLFMRCATGCIPCDLA